jgi:hypothetical protein
MGICKHKFEPKGYQKEKQCKNLEHLNGFCVEHQPPKPSNKSHAVPLTWQAMQQDGTTTVNPAFQIECNAMAKRINEVCQNGIHPGGMTFQGKKGTFQLLHDTQPRSNNVFFYNWNGNVLTVYGVGYHSGQDNKHYKLVWYNGSSASVDLTKKTIT